MKLPELDAEPVSPRKERYHIVRGGSPVSTIAQGHEWRWNRSYVLHATPTTRSKRLNLPCISVKPTGTSHDGIFAQHRISLYAKRLVALTVCNRLGSCGDLLKREHGVIQKRTEHVRKFGCVSAIGNKAIPSSAPDVPPRNGIEHILDAAHHASRNTPPSPPLPSPPSLQQ